MGASAPKHFRQQLQPTTKKSHARPQLRGWTPLPPHAFRMGATQEILNSGSAFPTILKSGIWTSGGYKCYLDLNANEAIDISALSVSALDSDSGDPDTLPTAPGDKKRDIAMGRPGNYYKNGKRWAIRPP